MGHLGDDWIVLENINRDLAGLYFNKKLQENSIYPDIRKFEESVRIRAIGEVLELKKIKKLITQMSIILHLLFLARL